MSCHTNSITDDGTIVNEKRISHLYSITYELCVSWFSLQITDYKALELPFHIYLEAHDNLILSFPGICIGNRRELPELRWSTSIRNKHMRVSTSTQLIENIRSELTICKYPQESGNPVANCGSP